MKKCYTYPKGKKQPKTPEDHKRLQLAKEKRIHKGWKGL